MYVVYESCTVYDDRDGIAGSRSIPVSRHASLDESFDAIDAIGESYGEADPPDGWDTFVWDEEREKKYYFRPVHGCWPVPYEGFDPLASSEVPF